MPIREYACDDCKNQWEELRKGQTHAEECPECGSKNLTKLMSTAGLNFVGDGFWRNDKKRYEPVKQAIFGINGQIGGEKLLPPDSHKEFNKPTKKNSAPWS